MALFLRAPLSSVSKLTPEQLIANIEALSKEFGKSEFNHVVYHLTRDIIKLEVSLTYGNYNSPYLIIMYYPDTDIVQVTLANLHHLFSVDLDLVLCFPKQDFANLLEMATLVKGTYVLMNPEIMFNLALQEYAFKLNSFLLSRETIIAKEFESKTRKIIDDLRYKVRMNGQIDFDTLLKRELSDGITIGEMLPHADAKYPGFSNEYMNYHGRVQLHRKEELQLAIDLAVADLHYVKNNLPALFKAFGGMEYAKSNIESTVLSLSDSIHSLNLRNLLPGDALLPLYVEALEKRTKLKDNEACVGIDERA